MRNQSCRLLPFLCLSNPKAIKRTPRPDVGRASSWDDKRGFGDEDGCGIQSSWDSHYGSGPAPAAGG